jgi:hypothetical protein
MSKFSVIYLDDEEFTPEDWEMVFGRSRFSSNEADAYITSADTVARAVNAGKSAICFVFNQATDEIVMYWR